MNKHKYTTLLIISALIRHHNSLKWCNALSAEVLYQNTIYVLSKESYDKNHNLSNYLVDVSYVDYTNKNKGCHINVELHYSTNHIETFTLFVSQHNVHLLKKDDPIKAYNRAMGVL